MAIHLRSSVMADDSGKLKRGNFIQALEAIRRDAEGLLRRKDLPPDVKAGLDRIIAQTRGEFDLGGDIE